jgi:hypothetical protein
VQIFPRSRVQDLIRSRTLTGIDSPSSKSAKFKCICNSSDLDVENACRSVGDLGEIMGVTLDLVGRLDHKQSTYYGKQFIADATAA